MNYFIKFETNYTKSLFEVKDKLESRKRISQFHDEKLKILLSIKCEDHYPQIEYEGIDIVPILNRAKIDFWKANNLSTYDNNWEMLENKINEQKFSISEKKIKEASSINLEDCLIEELLNVSIDMEESHYKPINKIRRSLKTKEKLPFLSSANIKNNIYKIPHKIKQYNQNKYLYRNLIKHIFAHEIIEDSIIKDLDMIIKTLKDFENNLFESEQVKEEFMSFKKMFEVIEPPLSILYKNTQHPVLEDYKIEILNIKRKVIENRKKVNSFTPAGTCFYKDRIELSIGNWNSSKKYGREWQKISLLAILFHELGHAIDFPFKESQIIKNEKNIIANSKSNSFSSKYKFSKIVRNNYLNSLKYSRVIKKRVSYYINPSIKYNQNNKIVYNWKRPEAETFAESMAYLLSWFMVGFNKDNTFMIKSKESRSRVVLQVLMKTMKYLLKNIKWEYIGIPKELIMKRKKTIEQFLNKINKMPMVLPKDGNIKRIRSRHMNSYKKPIIKNLIKK